MKKAFIKEYFKRIQTTIPSELTLEALSTIQNQHTQTIPFEGLNPLLGIPVKLDLESLVKKLIFDKRGGYCFEQNILLKHVLKTLGFKVRGLMGRVTLPNNVQVGRTHMFLLVEFEEKPYIVDVGFGGLVPNQPLLVETNIIQKTSLGVYQIIEQTPSNLLLKVKVKSKWLSLYSFDLEEYTPADYEVGNWYTSTHPNSNFTNNLIVSMNTDKSRYTLNNNKLSIHHAHHPSEKKQLKSAEEIITVLSTIFQINLSELVSLKDRLSLLNS